MVGHNMLRDGDKTMLRHLKFEITGSSSSLVKFRELCGVHVLSFTTRSLKPIWGYYCHTNLQRELNSSGMKLNIGCDFSFPQGPEIKNLIDLNDLCFNSWALQHNIESRGLL